ncbi:YppE family protein [Bacillus marinisedimentorum]|uniref:YppE family protein n=1 Tax=Bacillus marinisedimentorum TaxID=1821260 RepID=UPI0009F4C681|nr:YppE family protein [Bacillus marinisedimentorum]
MHNQTRELKKLTNELLGFVAEALEIYENPQEGREVDFYGEVKPFADKMKASADKWQELAETWLKENKPDYLHMPQIVSTHENLKIMSIQAFYRDTRKRKFQEMVQSVHYVLKSLDEKI